MYQTPQFEPIERTFVLTGQARKRIVVSTIVAIASLCFAAIGFAIVVSRPLNPIAAHFLTTVPVSIVLGAIVNFLRLRRSPTSLTVGRNGIDVERNGDIRTIPWEEVGWSTIRPIEPAGHQQLVIYDIAGSTLLKLTDAITDFDQLVKLVRLYTAMTPGSKSEEKRRRRARREPYLILSFGLLFLVITAFIAWNTWDNQRRARLLQDAAIPGNAEIVRLFVAPNGVTKRLEYRVNVPGEQLPTRNVEITEELWAKLQGATTVPVLFVPDEPDISRLESGEVPPSDDGHSPIFDYGLSLAGSLFALLFIGNGLLNVCGRRLDFDPIRRRFYIKPYRLEY